MSAPGKGQDPARKISKVKTAWSMLKAVECLSSNQEVECKSQYFQKMKNRKHSISTLWNLFSHKEEHNYVELWLKLEIILSRIIQTQKNNYHIFSFICRIQTFKKMKQNK
jgi:hypothetical protein